jgi:hypothetical protein
MQAAIDSILIEAIGQRQLSRKRSSRRQGWGGGHWPFRLIASASSTSEVLVSVTRILRFFWDLAGIDTYLFGIIW